MDQLLSTTNLLYSYGTPNQHCLHHCSHCSSRGMVGVVCCGSHGCHSSNNNNNVVIIVVVVVLLLVVTVVVVVVEVLQLQQ